MLIFYPNRTEDKIALHIYKWTILAFSHIQNELRLRVEYSGCASQSPNVWVSCIHAGH